MRKVSCLGGFVVAGLLACSGAWAQARGGGGFVRSMPAQRAPSVRMISPPRISTPLATTSFTTRQGTVLQLTPNGSFTPFDFSSGGTFFFANDNDGVPGLGFDFPHLAAVSGNFRFNPPFFRHHRGFFGNPFINTGFIGFPLGFDLLDTGEFQPVQQQPQIIVLQQPAPTVVVQQPAAPAAGPANPPEDSAASSAPPAPVRDVGEFILVRQDGKILFASAYSVVGTQLRYVTPEGFRRTLPLADLDAQATQEMNEARGTTVQIQN